VSGHRASHFDDIPKRYGGKLIWKKEGVRCAYGHGPLTAPCLEIKGNDIYDKYPGNSSHDPTTGLNETKGIAAGVVQVGKCGQALDKGGWGPSPILASTRTNCRAPAEYQLGYAAAVSSGWRSSGPPLDRWDIGNLTQMYLGNLTATALAGGIPSDRVRQR
jgi:hypothetical protein